MAIAAPRPATPRRRGNRTCRRTAVRLTERVQRSARNCRNAWPRGNRLDTVEAASRRELTPDPLAQRRGPRRHPATAQRIGCGYSQADIWRAGGLVGCLRRKRSSAKRLASSEFAIRLSSLGTSPPRTSDHASCPDRFQQMASRHQACGTAQAVRSSTADEGPRAGLVCR